jgi:predicted PurR-regulated permease PerM
VKVREEVVFKWLLIIAAAVAFLVAVTLVTRPLVGAILFALALVAACVYAYRWSVRKWRESRR